MAKAASQRSLDSWTKQKWRTKSGKPSTQGPKATGERYLPEAPLKREKTKLQVNSFLNNLKVQLKPLNDIGEYSW